jgi:hypothetical protein
MLAQVLSINTSAASADKVVPDETEITNKTRAGARCELFY